MYTEEENYGKRPFPFRDFLLKLILVIIFVFLLVWLLPKFISPSTKKVTDNSSLTSQIFADNLEKMKQAAMDYYKEDYLPKNLNESKTMTLREMIKNNLLTPFLDKDGKACNVDDSYVKVTKEENEYLLKVNLKCSSEEDYVLVHIGDYNYCNQDICEKDVTAAEAQTNHTSSINEQSDSYQGSVGSSIENAVRQESSSTNEKPNNGVTQGSQTETITQPKTLYEYTKTSSTEFSEWSAWSAWQLNSEGLKELDCNDQDPTCVRKIQLYTRKEQTGVYHGEKGDVPIYGMVTYYSEKTRTIVSQGTTDIRWSTYNDTTLLNNGYSYTGNTKVE